MKKLIYHCSETVINEGKTVVEAGRLYNGFTDDDMLKLTIEGLEGRTVVVEGIVDPSGVQRPYYTNPESKSFYAVRQLEPMETIETELWLPNPEKPGYLKMDRKRTIGEVFADIKQALKEQKVWDDLDYFSLSTDKRDEDEPFPDFNWISVFVVRGGSEGYYYHIEAIKGDKRRLLYLGKTLHEKIDDAIKINNVLVKLFQS